MQVETTKNNRFNTKTKSMYFKMWIWTSNLMIKSGFRNIF